MENTTHIDTAQADPHKTKFEMPWTLGGGVAGILGSLLFRYCQDIPCCIFQTWGALGVAGSALLSHWLCTVKYFKHGRLRKILKCTAIVLTLCLFVLPCIPQEELEYAMGLLCGCGIAVLASISEQDKGRGGDTQAAESHPVGSAPDRVEKAARTEWTDSRKNNCKKG